jgi:hypothetical protein
LETDLACIAKFESNGRSGDAYCLAIYYVFPFCVQSLVCLRAIASTEHTHLPALFLEYSRVSIMLIAPNNARITTVLLVSLMPIVAILIFSDQIARCMSLFGCLRRTKCEPLVLRLSRLNLVHRVFRGYNGSSVDRESIAYHGCVSGITNSDSATLVKRKQNLCEPPSVHYLSIFVTSNYARGKDIPTHYL